MELAKLSVDYRSSTRKSAVRRLRAQGKIPAICYGAGVDPIALTVDPLQLLKALDPVKKTNTVISMSVKGGPGGDQELTVMMRDYQRDSLKGDLLHADFIRVQLDKDVHAMVPVILTGKAEGVKLGGILHQVIRNLEIACKPHLIPIKLEIDVTELDMGDSLHVRDLKLGEGIKALRDGGETVCAVNAPKAEKVAEPTAAEVEAAALAAAAAPVEGAAVPGAEGAKAGAAAPGIKPAPGAAPPAAATPPAKERGEKGDDRKKGKREKE